MPTLFLSHATEDDPVVARLREALAELGEAVWIDSRQLRGGQLLWPAIRQAIDEAAAYAVLVSPASLQSDWVGEELAHALERQRQCGADAFPVIPLTLDGTRLGAYKRQFDAEPAYIPISSAREVSTPRSTRSWWPSAAGSRRSGRPGPSPAPPRWRTWSCP